MCRACLPPLPHPSMCERGPPRPPQQKSVSRTCEHGAMPALDKPRVIAEVRKSVGSVGGGALLGGKPRISVIRPSDGDVKPGGPLGAIRQE
ncbi:hypothetical protein ANN_11878 [Periplaneta americana]|uniref:PDZ domain-containing protein n=1 Tax=Periplaneta americana TaxID=6978 RepID=A0ABQ8T695_PERAM|nr:hypothetical protein ANN_11878 [Periplaneta americana]